jgi:hypothetical protein
MALCAAAPGDTFEHRQHGITHEALLTAWRSLDAAIQQARSAQAEAQEMAAEVESADLALASKEAALEALQQQRRKDYFAIAAAEGACKEADSKLLDAQERKRAADELAQACNQLTAPAKLGIELMGCLLDEQQLVCFTQLVDGSRQLQFPSCLRQFVGKDVVVRPGDASSMHPLRWVQICKPLAVQYSSRHNWRFCRVFSSSATVLGPQEQCGLQQAMYDLRGATRAEVGGAGAGVPISSISSSSSSTSRHHVIC